MMNENPINVLMYHNIADGFDLNGTTVSPRNFERQIEFLANNVKILPLLEQVKNRKNSADESWSLTFDDGFRGVYEYAFPVMKKYDMKGTLYIATDLVNKSSDWNMNIGWQRYQHLTWKEIKEMADAGWEIGAHSVNHLSLKLITLAKAKKEILDSISIIENEVGVKVKSFSYPFGHYTKAIRDFIEELGLDYAVSVRFEDDYDPYLIPRHGVYNFDGLHIFKKIIRKKGWQRYIYGKNRFITTLNNLSGLIINFKHQMGQK